MVYFELLKPGETVNTDRYRQQIINLNHALIEKQPEWGRRPGKVILQHDNAPSHNAKMVKNTLKANFEEVEKWLVEWFALKEKKLFGMVSMICLKDGQNVQNPMVNTLNKIFLRFP